MFAIDRQHGGPMCHGRIQHQLTGADQRLFIRKGKRRALFQRLHPRCQTRGPDDGGHDPIGGACGGLVDGLCSGGSLYPRA